MTNVPILKFMFRSEWKALSDALQFNPANKSLGFNSANDVATFLEGVQGGLIVVSLADKNDLIQLATLIKFLKRNDSAACTKIAVVNISGDRHFEKAVAKLGILDLIDPKIPTKALRYKIDYMMKSVSAQVKKKESAVAETVKKLETKSNADKKLASNSPVWTDPLKCEDDIWIIRNETDCKKILSRWLVKLSGPSPYVAGWVETNTRGTWKFEFKTTPSIFETGAGAWYFQGDQKPDFIWSENSWAFTGNGFELFFKSDSAKISRMTLEGSQFTVARTSDSAMKRDKDIQDSFDKNLVFKNGLQGNADKDSFEKEEDEFGNLEGKGKTDTITHKSLSGKNKTAHLNTDPLKMDLEATEANASKDPHSLKTSTTKGTSFWKGDNKHEKEETKSGELSTEIDEVAQSPELSLEGNSNHQSHYKNQNKPGKVDPNKDPLSHKTSTSKGTSFWKGKNEYSEEESSGGMDAPSVDGVNEGSELSLGGNSKHQAHYKNHNEPEKFEGKEKSHSLKKDGVSENLQGRVDTEKNKSKDPSDLNGASSTDKLKSHLTSPNGEVRKESEEKSRKERSEKSHSHDSNSSQKPQGDKERATKESADAAANPDKDLGGKSSTDKLNGPLRSSHAKKENNSEESDKTDKEIGGKSSTDNLGGPLSSRKAVNETSEAAGKMADQLAALRAKKEKLENERNSKESEGHSRNSASGSASQASRNKSENHTESKSKHQHNEVSEKTHKEKQQAGDSEAKDSHSATRMDIQLQSTGNLLVLPDNSVNKSFEAMSLGSVDLDSAVLNAKITSVLIQSDFVVTCHLDDHFDDVIIFTSPESALISIKPVTLDLNFNYMDKKTNLKFPGSVTQIESDGDGMQYVTVQISKENADEFNSFMQLYKTRQDNINLFLKTAKGY
jgi:hypothetical protein